MGQKNRRTWNVIWLLSKASQRVLRYCRMMSSQPAILVNYVLNLLEMERLLGRTTN